MSKTRLAKDGTPVQAPKGKELKGDLERISTQKAEGYCELSSEFGADRLLTARPEQAAPATEERHQQKDPTLDAATLARRSERRTFAEGGASSIRTRSSR